MVKTKVMHVIRNLAQGGIQRTFLCMADGLQDRGNTENAACIVADYPDVQGSLSACRNVTRLRIPQFDFFLGEALLKPAEFLLLLQAFMRENPDVVCAYYNPPGQLLAAIAGKLLGKKVVMRKFTPESNLFWMHRLMNRLAYSICDKVITAYPAGKEELADIGVPAGKVAYIPNGREPRQFSSLLEKPEAKKRLGLSPDDFVVGMISRLHPVKNHAAVIKALPKLLEERKGIRLVLAGDSPHFGYGDGLKRLVSSLGLERNVIFLGIRSDVADVLAAFDLFVHPSYAESCPGAVLEAMCAGLPIVATDAGGMDEMLEGCGTVIPAGNCGKLAQEMENLMKNPERMAEHGMKARARMRCMYSLELMLERYEGLFLALDGKRDSG